MLDKLQINEWQFIDKELDLVYPWYTNSFLDELKTWNLLDKKILEFGGGFSTLWWNAKCHFVYTLEKNIDWSNKILETNSNINIFNEVDDILDIKYDIIIIDNDDIERDAMIPLAMALVKDNGIIICDNWMQAEVWISKCPDLLEKYEHKIFKQEGHPNWQTAYFIINKSNGTEKS